jgi:chromosomal replication initiation ATPase DnaA
MSAKASGGGAQRQLTLDLDHRPALGREDFIVTPANEEAVASIDRWPAWPHPVLIVTGPKGSGKTHLAAVWCRMAEAACVPAAALGAQHLAALEGGGSLAVEDADRGFDEEVLFHAINLARGEDAFLVLTAAEEPSAWPVRLPDLKSRLRAAPVARLGAPDDLLLRAVLVKLFSDRQLAVDASVLDYICARMERSLAAASRLVAALDAAALAEGRGITRRLAAEVLAEGGSRDEES